MKLLLRVSDHDVGLQGDRPHCEPAVLSSGVWTYSSPAFRNFLQDVGGAVKVLSERVELPARWSGAGRCLRVCADYGVPKAGKTVVGSGSSDFYFLFCTLNNIFQIFCNSCVFLI